MSQNDVHTITQALKTYGGGFMQALAEALTRADEKNRQKILLTWKNDIDNVVKLYTLKK